jgi:hypothetical protein
MLPPASYRFRWVEGAWRWPFFCWKHADGISGMFLLPQVWHTTRIPRAVKFRLSMYAQDGRISGWGGAVANTLQKTYQRLSIKKKVHILLCVETAAGRFSRIVNEYKTRSCAAFPDQNTGRQRQVRGLLTIDSCRTYCLRTPDHCWEPTLASGSTWPRTIRARETWWSKSWNETPGQTEIEWIWGFMRDAVRFMIGTQGWNKSLKTQVVASNQNLLAGFNFQAQ